MSSMDRVLLTTSYTMITLREKRDGRALFKTPPFASLLRPTTIKFRNLASVML